MLIVFSPLPLIPSPSLFVFLFSVGLLLTNPHESDFFQAQLLSVLLLLDVLPGCLNRGSGRRSHMPLRYSGLYTNQMIHSGLVAVPLLYMHFKAGTINVMSAAK